MPDYQNISRVDKLDDGTMNIFMKNGRRAFIQFERLEAAFKATIYRLREGEIRPGESFIKQVTNNGGLQECARDAIGWIDENSLILDGPEEIKKIEK